MHIIFRRNLPPNECTLPNGQQASVFLPNKRFSVGREATFVLHFALLSLRKIGDLAKHHRAAQISESQMEQGLGCRGGIPVTQILS
ncbi:hypothetical protein AVEN_262643-1 [Araneus ventricosus]|uniref:Uncharacterized protein n=1 Tax=Araneus ventricosus TaxID=182803 RepID=A0A4Y2P034_ARAVE|nr:hypothetical protein AVEN_262643-1 [Araneus ventricosus]